MNIKEKRLIFIAAICVFCAGCSRAPSVEVLGSFFPAWLFCLTSGVIFAFVARYILSRFHLESEVGPPALFYPSVVLLVGALIWLIHFS
jgi:hypothetical protein